MDLSFHGASGQAADDLTLEEQDQTRTSGAVAETTEATANMTLPLVLVVPRKLAIFGTMVWFSFDNSIAVTAKSL